MEKHEVPMWDDLVEGTFDVRLLDMSEEIVASTRGVRLVERLNIAHGDRYAIRTRLATETPFTSTLVMSQISGGVGWASAA